MLKLTIRTCDDMKNNTVYSIGHSNVSEEQFINFIKNLSIKFILDVRSTPNSKNFPHFNKNSLRRLLKENNISYIESGDKLGGRQRVDYKDYILTPEYHDAIKQVERRIQKETGAIMCSENNYKNCHRRFISETLLRHGYNVVQVKQSKNELIIKQMHLEKGSEKIESLCTIGYTKKSLEDFVNILRANNITKVVDIRLKNTSQLAGFAKADDLRFLLENLLNIKYIHDPQLSPTEEIFNKYKKDNNWEDYVGSFSELMKERKMDKKIEKLMSNLGNVCLLCSEDSADKCHRRLVAEYYKTSITSPLKLKHLTKKDVEKSIITNKNSNIKRKAIKPTSLDDLNH